MLRNVRRGEEVIVTNHYKGVRGSKNVKLTVTKRLNAPYEHRVESLQIS